jgi:hypothetical protein
VQGPVTPDDPDIASKQIVLRLFAVVGAFASVVGASLWRMVARGGESAFFDWLGPDNQGTGGKRDPREIRPGANLRAMAKAVEPRSEAPVAADSEIVLRQHWRDLFPGRAERAEEIDRRN